MALSKEEVKSIAYNAKLELARRNFKYYLEFVHHGRYTRMSHTDLICDELQPIAEGEQRFIMIEMPPRHGKSYTITESFPSYYIGKNPFKRVITSAYSETLAKDFGRYNRLKIKEFGIELFGVGISRTSSNVSDWNVDNEIGGMLSTGIGGSITGKGADLLIIDDPIKNNQEAQSETIRNKIWSEWEATLSTRLQKGGSVIVVQTRWHEDDLIGRLLERSPRQWRRIRLPAIAEDEDDLLGRKIGEPLAPMLGYDEEWAEMQKLEVGSKTWASLYQQRPSASEGNLFKREWWQYYDTLPSRIEKTVFSWDLTFKGAEENDYVVGQLWAKAGANYYLIDQVRAKLDFPQTVKQIEMFCRKYPNVREVLIEDKANGSAVISTLKNKISGIIPISPKGSKEARANAITPFIEAGNVYLPNKASFLSDFIEEVSNFPYGKNDDQVDCMTQAINKMEGGHSARIYSNNVW